MAYYWLPILALEPRAIFVLIIVLLVTHADTLAEREDRK